MNIYLRLFTVLAMACSLGFADLCTEYLAAPDIATKRASRVVGHFEATTRISRDSYKEKAFRMFLEGFARRYGRDVVVQESQRGGGNLLVRVPATAKYVGSKQVVAISGHMDMVQKMNDAWLRALPESQRQSAQQAHFDKGPQLAVAGRTVYTRGFRSTNGADNGVGIATMMALIEGGSFEHPELELIFTWGEEKGLHGAQEWDIPLRATKLITLDGEKSKVIHVGSKGAMMLGYELSSLRSEPVKDGLHSFHIELMGLAGGHSGADVHLGRGNSAVIAQQLVSAIRERFPHGQLISLAVGDPDLFTVIPTSFDMKIALREEDAPALQALVQEHKATLRSQLKELQSNFDLKATPAGAASGKAVDSNQLGKIITALKAVPDAVVSQAEGKGYFGDVETSNNHSFLFLNTERMYTGFMPRSFLNDPIAQLKSSIASSMSKDGLEWSLTVRADYPAWQPQENSPMVALARRLLERKGYQFTLCPGGIEPAIFMSKFPQLSAINFPPTTIRGAHTFKEQFDIPELILGLEDFQALLSGAGDEG